MAETDVEGDIDDRSYQPGDEDQDHDSDDHSYQPGDKGLVTRRKVLQAQAMISNKVFVAPAAGKRVREKKRCPVRNCNAQVISLPRHLRLRHGWSHNKSVAAVSNFELRKPYTYSAEKKKPKAVDSYYLRRCPADDCYAVVKRMAPHIRKHHKVTDELLVQVLLKQSKQTRSRCVEVIENAESE